MPRIHATLHRALRDAVRWGKLTRNPADQSDPPKASASKAIEMRTWSADELRFFIREVRGDRLYAAWLTAGKTGLRRGELLGLMWNDVDLTEGMLSIRRARVSCGGVVVLSDPKTRRSRRVVALDQTAIAALPGASDQALEDRLGWGAGWKDTGFAFAREDGTPLHPESLSKMFHWRVRRANLPRIRFHDLRHTHATLALQARVHPKVVSERLGHSSIGITLDTYSHAMQEEAAAELIASLVFDR